MSRDKQIEEMAKTMCFQANSCNVKSCVQVNCEKTWLAEALYNAGYRKSTDVAREMIENLANDLWEGEFDTLNISVGKRFYNKQEFIAELKKKYTEGENK